MEKKNQYILLGFRDLPINPNDFGFKNEADNPFVFGSLRWAFKALEVVQEKIDTEDPYGVAIKVRVVELVEMSD